MCAKGLHCLSRRVLLTGPGGTTPATQTENDMSRTDIINKIRAIDHIIMCAMQDDIMPQAAFRLARKEARIAAVHTNDGDLLDALRRQDLIASMGMR